MLCRYDALRSLCLNSRVLPRSLSFSPRSGEGSFCRCNLPSTGTSLSCHGCPSCSACSRFLKRLLKSQLALLKLLRHQWLILRYFFAFLLFRSASPASLSFLCHAFTYFSVRYFSILPNVVLRFACWFPRVYSGVFSIC